MFLLLPKYLAVSRFLESTNTKRELVRALSHFVMQLTRAFRKLLDYDFYLSTFTFYKSLIASVIDFSALIVSKLEVKTG